MKEQCHEYWSSEKANLDGMLGGHSQIDPIDIAASKEFLEGLMPAESRRLCLDCGSGIGRITRNLLLPLFEYVDMVDFSQAYLDQSVTFIPPGDGVRVRNRFCSTLQDFTPQPDDVYSVIWVQWVTGYLDDEDFIEFLKRCRKALNDSCGFIVVKDNVVLSYNDGKVDEDDGSYFRTLDNYLDVFKAAGLVVYSFKEQANMRSFGFHPIYMFALK